MSPRTRNRPRRSLAARALVVGVALVTVGGVAWAGLRVVDRGDPSGHAADEPGVSHVHGLGINPADGALIVATHFGSFRIAGDAEAERIGESFQDTMGFTVAGRDHFFGSGHPDFQAARSGAPTRLGLIESKDAGETWTALSLRGKADFHGLAVAHDRVYGWDAGSGRFMVSSDRRAWQVRSSVDLSGFAVDPSDPEGIVGVAPSGLIESKDGGRSWRPSEGPKLTHVSWDAKAGLWGADLAGAVWHRGTSGWERVGVLAGEPEALLVTGDVFYAAALDSEDRTGIYRSTDGGLTWSLRYQDRAP